MDLERFGCIAACLATFLFAPGMARGQDPLVLDKTIAMPGVREPQGVLFIARTGQVFVANAGGGVSILAGAPLRISEGMTGLDDADNLRIDSSAERLYVGYGHALAMIDVAGRRISDRIALAGHPEGFELDPRGARIYVNVPSAGQIAVLDRDRREQIATWRVVEAAANFPMAIDAIHRRLFVGARRPPQLLYSISTAASSWRARRSVAMSTISFTMRSASGSMRSAGRAS